MFFMAEFYQDYDKIIRLACPCYDYCLELITKNIPANADSVLDLGSGTGNLALSILKNVHGIKIYGIELQQSLVEIAEGKTDDPNAIFIQGDILGTDWPEAECITSSLALHHLSHYQKRKVFKKIHNLSRSFLYFDRVKGRNRKEEKGNLEYVFRSMRKNGLPERIIREGKKDMARNDNPLTAKQINNLLESIGFEYEVLYLKYGFGVYSCTKKE